MTVDGSILAGFEGSILAGIGSSFILVAWASAARKDLISDNDWIKNTTYDRSNLAKHPWLGSNFSRSVARGDSDRRA